MVLLEEENTDKNIMRVRPIRRLLLVLAASFFVVISLPWCFFGLKIGLFHGKYFLTDFNGRIIMTNQRYD